MKSQIQILRRTTLASALLIIGILLKLFLPAPNFSQPGGNELADDFVRPSAEFSTITSRLERNRQVARLGVEPWHRAGNLGAGIKVAVLDSGFRGYRSYLGDVLPAQIKVHSFRHDGNLEARDSQHGIMCGEVIHALAPKAEILFANWEQDEPDTFLEAVRWARNEGARVVSCSVIMPSWSDGNGGGAVHRELTSLLGNGKAESDMLCFACAGNTAERHWAGSFHPASDGFHDWRDGVTKNRVRPWGKEQVSVELYAAPGSGRFELSVCDADTGTVLGKSTTRTEGERSTAVVRFDPDGARSYCVRLRRLAVSAGQFHLVSLAGDLDIATSQGSVSFPADGPEVIAVGAVDEDNHRMSYSSCGPNSGHTKPDMVATVPFMTFCRARPFSGTSAAAPQAAALAALVWSQNKSWIASDIARQLLQSTSDLGQPGPDFETGYGRVRLPIPGRDRSASLSK